MEIESNQKRLRRREKGRKYQTFCKNDMNKKRVIWIELLRVMACIGVIGIHAGSQHFRDMPLDSSVWAVSNRDRISTRQLYTAPITPTMEMAWTNLSDMESQTFVEKKYSADSCSIYFLADVLRSIQDYYKWNAGEGQQSSPGQIYGIYQ